MQKREAKEAQQNSEKSLSESHDPESNNEDSMYGVEDDDSS